MSTRRRDAAAVLLAFAAGVFASSLQTIFYGWPVPAVHDEFSNLVAADTFFHGRCTNPTPAFWQHFETIHVLMKPTYASKYPPAQGLSLALGRLIGGYPAVGVWLGVGFACASGTWMLRAFVPRRWAFAGGMLMASRLGLSTWGWTYYGGGLAAAAGCLLIGGWLRAMQRPRPGAAAVMALGVSLLAVTRPFEGLLLCGVVGIATLVRLLRRQVPATARTLIVPAMAVLIPAALALAYYDYRVTGNALRLPYLEHGAQYEVAPPMLIPFEAPLITYRHKEIKDYHWDYEAQAYNVLRSSFSAWRDFTVFKLREWWRFFMGWSLTLPLLALPWALAGSRRCRFALVGCICMTAVVGGLVVFGAAHYIAPATGLLFAVITVCLRRIALARPFGRQAAAVLVGAGLLAPAIDLLPANHRPTAQWSVERNKTAEILAQMGDKHLVFVQYGEGHSYLDEWVYNEADIDHAKIIWARPINRDEAGRMADYYPDRSIWLMSVSPRGGQIKLLRPPLHSQ
jgi:hypothetical protein